MEEFINFFKELDFAKPIDFYNQCRDVFGLEKLKSLYDNEVEKIMKDIRDGSEWNLTISDSTALVIVAHDRGQCFISLFDEKKQYQNSVIKIPVKMFIKDRAISMNIIVYDVVQSNNIIATTKDELSDSHKRLKLEPRKFPPAIKISKYNVSTYKKKELPHNDKKNVIYGFILCYEYWYLDEVKRLTDSDKITTDIKKKRKDNNSIKIGNSSVKRITHELQLDNDNFIQNEGFYIKPCLGSVEEGGLFITKVFIPNEYNRYVPAKVGNEPLSNSNCHMIFKSGTLIKKMTINISSITLSSVGISSPIKTYKMAIKPYIYDEEKIDKDFLTDIENEIDNKSEKIVKSGSICSGRYKNEFSDEEDDENNLDFM